MSAFVCSQNHIAAIASYAVAKKVWLGNASAKDSDFKSIYETLARANVVSVCHRYSDDKPENYRDVLRSPKLSSVQHSALQIVKLCDCLDYQSCETEDWRDSDACKLLSRIRDAAINALPGYDDVKWAIA
jgi:hypothetical protein